MVGSAVYSASWLSAARDFIRDHAAVLAERHTWTFTVGRLAGQGGILSRVNWPDGEELPALRDSIGVLDQRFLTGALHREALPFLQRAAFGLLGGRVGDFRNWAEVDAFAENIAGSLLDGGTAARDSG